MIQRRFTLIGVAILTVFLFASAAYAEFSLNGFVQSQFGIFTATDTNKTEYNADKDDYYPVEHGGLYGKPSMFRNTLQIEADYSPFDKVNLHAVFRGVRSASLAADDWAQVPVFYADTSFNNNAATRRAKRNWVRETYYTENDLRELFLDIEATSWLSFRVGRQQVSWGETGSFKLLDIVNPENTTWHFGPFEQFEDTRVPLWILKTLIDIPPLAGNLELLWVPLVDKPENTVTVPLTFVGAWGLPVAPKPEFLSNLTIERKEMIYPANDMTDSRMGVRWKGLAGPITYTMMYYYTHHLSPPIPAYVEKLPQANAQTGLSDTRVYLEFPRQHVTGLTFDYAIPRPLSTALKVEMAYFPRTPYPVNSYLEPGHMPEGFQDWEPSPDNPAGAKNGDPDYRIRNNIHHEEKDTLNYALVLLRPNQIRWLNKHSSIITQFQVFQSLILEDLEIKEKVGDEWKVNENWYMVSIPGYDTSRVSKYNTLYIFAALTSYYHGIFNPMVVAVIAPGGDDDYLGSWDINTETWSGFVSAQIKFVLGDNWRIETGVHQIFGADPYVNLGLFRDRDEVYGKVMYQF